jgi:hypothetical protein
MRVEQALQPFPDSRQRIAVASVDLAKEGEQPSLLVVMVEKDLGDVQFCLLVRRQGAGAERRI